MCLSHGLRDLYMTRLGLLALNGYESGVINILIGSLCNIGWCIVGVGHVASEILRRGELISH